MLVLALMKVSLAVLDRKKFLGWDLDILMADRSFKELFGNKNAKFDVKI